ncbi:MAG: phosphotransferase [Deltaproteobacteria bacterium]|nr:phosphotransferase [Deltaproteobacteria bacterium]
MTTLQHASPSLALAPDPCLPQRDTLLSAPEMARRFSILLDTSGDHTPHTFTRCEWTRAKYRIGESLRVLYQLRIDDTAYAVTARTFRNGASAQAYQTASRTALPCGPLPAVLHDPTLDTVFWTFPNDRKIAHLSLLHNVPPHLSQLLAQPWGASRLVSYAPERAAIAQCLSADGTVLAYAKLYAGTEGEQSFATHNALYQHVPVDDPHLRLPRAFAYTARERLLLLEPIVGQHAEALDEEALPDATRRFGAAVARLHSLPPPPNVPEFSHLTISALHTAARVLAQVRPDIGEGAERLVRELDKRWDTSDELSVCLHGDVNFKNWLATSDRVALIDLDAVSTGPAAADIGGVLSGLWYRYRVGRFSAATERHLARAFLAGYAAVRPLPSPAIVRWYTAAALLAERVLRAVTRIRPEGLPHLNTLLTDAHTLLTGRCHD